MSIYEKWLRYILLATIGGMLGVIFDVYVLFQFPTDIHAIF